MHRGRCSMQMSPLSFLVIGRSQHTFILQNRDSQCSPRVLVTVNGTSLAKLKAASQEDSGPVRRSSSHMSHLCEDLSGPTACLNSTPVCRYKEKASFRSKWLSIDRGRRNWNILHLIENFIIINYCCKPLPNIGV